jgi:hypothetical protein
MRQLIDKWSESDQAQELLQESTIKVNLPNMHKRATNVREILLKGSEDYLTILDRALLMNYFLLDSKIGRSKEALEFDRIGM